LDRAVNAVGERLPCRRLDEHVGRGADVAHLRCRFRWGDVGLGRGRADGGFIGRDCCDLEGCGRSRALQHEALDQLSIAEEADVGGDPASR
jgi:hypothetical protein